MSTLGERNKVEGWADVAFVSAALSRGSMTHRKRDSRHLGREFSSAMATAFQQAKRSINRLGIWEKSPTAVSSSNT